MKKVYIIIFSLLASGFIFFAVEGTSKAAEWPGNEWGPGTDMEIMLSKNKNHKSDRGTRVKFAYYAKNNQGQKRITFVKTICGSKQGSQATARSGVNVVSFSNGSCGNKQLNLGNGSNMIISGVNYTKYEISVELATGANADQDDPWNNPNLAVFRFGVDYDDSNGNFVGYLKDGTTSLPINSRLNNNEDYLPSDLRIKVSCNVGSINGIITFYDSDNNKDLFAQPEKNYTPVKYKVTDTLLEWTDSAPNGWGYNVNNNFWWPQDTTSSSLRTARVAIPSDSKDRYFVIRNLGQGNYNVFDLPFDETRPNCDPPPKCPAPYDYLSPPLCPPQERFNWAVVPSASVDKNIALLGETVRFIQTQSRATGVGWMSDEYTSDRVDANIITTKDGNIINSTDFHTEAGGVIAKSKPENITMNQTGEYCQYINYPVGFLGKRKTPNYRNTGYTFRWVYTPSRDDRSNGNSQENMTAYNPVGNPPTGGYDRWWLASTTDDTPDSNSANGWNQYWAFHNFNDLGSAGDGQDGASGMWRWYGGSQFFSGGVLANWLNYGYRTDAGHPTASEMRHPWEVYGWWNPNGSYNNFNHDGPKACVTVINPNPESNANDYEKNTVDQEINHSVSLGVNSCPVFSTPVDIEARGEDGVVFYDQTMTASFGGSNCTWTLSPVKKIPYTQLNDKPPGYSVTYSTILGLNGKPSIKSFRVFEVPFARFYGNDVYSTSRNAGEGKFRFNDSDNANAGTYQERGSVAQYAAFAAGSATNYLDTAAFRYFGSALNPKPATGLLSEGSELSDISAENVYSKITQSKPSGCLNSLNSPIPQDGNRIYGGMSPGSVSVCYDISSGTNLNATPLNVNPWVYGNKKVTIFYTGNLHITKDFVNNTPVIDRTDPEKTGVALFVADNIYIDKNVTRVDAILVANNTIDTCYNSTVIAWGVANSNSINGNTINNTNLEDAGQCRNKLVINGSVSAKTVKFKRVGGSRYLAPVGTLPGNAVGSGVIEKDGQTNLPLNSGLSAEIINFPAYLYWAQPYLFNESTSGGKVNSIYTAPPRQ